MDTKYDSMKNQAYFELKNLILKDVLHPGQKVTKAEIEDSLAIGKTPLREAMIRLSEEHLLNIIPQSGTYISKIDVDEIKQGLFIRRTLETKIMEEAFDSISEDNIIEIEQILTEHRYYTEKKDIDKHFEYDDKFHKYFYDLTGKQFVWNWLSLINTQFNRYRYIRLEVVSIPWDSINAQHEIMLDNLKKKDKKSMLKEIDAHFHLFDNDFDKVHNQFPNYFI